jgi:hypothetical protein
MIARICSAVPMSALLLLSLSACSTNAPAYVANVDRSRGEVVAVRHFDASLAPLNYEGQTDFGTIMAEYVAGALQEQGIQAVAVAVGEPLPANTEIEVQVDLLYLEPGSWNLRFWIGFGAGRALVTARASLFAVQDGELVVEVTRRAKSNTWQGAERILRRTCARVARAIAADLRKEIILRRRGGAREHNS